MGGDNMRPPSRQNGYNLLAKKGKEGTLALIRTKQLFFMEGVLRSAAVLDSNIIARGIRFLQQVGHGGTSRNLLYVHY